MELNSSVASQAMRSKLKSRMHSYCVGWMTKQHHRRGLGGCYAKERVGKNVGVNGHITALWRKSDVLWQPERGPEKALPLASPLTEKRHLGHFQNGYGEYKEQLKTLATDVSHRRRVGFRTDDCRL
jgi:hypothetical protein